MRLREKFVIPVIFIIVLGLGVSAMISYGISKRSIESLINNELLIVSKSLELQLKFWLKINKNKIVELSQDEYTRRCVYDTVMRKNVRKEADQFLLNQKKHNESFNSLQIINQDGVIVASSGNVSLPSISDQIPLSLSLDFNQALHGAVVITDIFKSSGMDSPVFFIMAPIYEQDHIVGVLAGQIKFKSFCRDMLAKVKVGKTGHAIICNPNGVVVCHPDKQLLFKSTLEDLAIYPDVEGKNKQFVDFDYKSQHQHAIIRTVQLTGWVLILAVDLAEINHPLHQVMTINGIIIGFSLFIALLIALGFSHLVTQPLRKIIDFSRLIGQGHFSHRLNICSNDEIGFLSLAMEKMARQLHENMTALAESNKELLKQRKAADAANRAKTDFLANMSHEIRTPMNAIIGFTSLMQTTELTFRQEDYLTKIDASAKSLLLVINEILDFSKIEANQLALENVDFHLRHLMNQLSSMFVIPAAEQGIELTINISRDVPQTLYGDSLRLRQILINLVSNAIKFTHKDAVKAKVIVAVRLQKRDKTRNTLQFSVSDSGIGIAEDEKEKLFDAFTQVDASTTRQFGGIGLGLSICQRLVGMMGGEISVESEVGVGSRFIFTVPFIRHDAEISKSLRRFELDCESWFQNKVEGEGGHVLAEKRVLVVDDNTINQQVVSEILTAEGGSVDVAENGLKAIEAVKTRPYDLVLMDLQMPIMGGEAATRIIREDERFQTLPIIAITAYTGSGTKGTCLDAGMTDYVTKPIEKDHLLAVLSQWIEKEEKGSAIRHSSAPSEWRQGSDRLDFDQLNLVGINIKNAMTRLCENGVLYQHLLRDFAKTAHSKMKKIACALERGENQIATKMVHTLKGTAGNLSADGVYNAAAALELTLSQNNGPDDAQTAEKRVEKIALQLNVLQHHLDPIVDTVMQWDDPSGETVQVKEPPKPKPPYSPHPPLSKNLNMNQVHPILEELTSLLFKNDTQALIAFDRLNEILAQSPCQERLNKIKILMDQFDFEAALPLLKEISTDLNQCKETR